ncbi:MAG: asparaginase domain-containing protein [Desulfatiglandaceae bacterium]
MKIKIIAVGGTIDKVYFDLKSEYQVGKPEITDILEEGNIGLEYACESILRKDSLELTEDDRQLIFEKIQSDENQRILVTHGTDTMVETARKLKGVPGKVIVLTGAMSPARFKSSDAPFNIGFAMAAVQLLPTGVYIAMNGRVFDPDHVVKNREHNRFEEI